MNTREKREVILATVDAVECEMINSYRSQRCPLCIAAWRQLTRLERYCPLAKCASCLIPGDEKFRCFDFTSKEHLVGLGFMLAMLNTGDL